MGNTIGRWRGLHRLPRSFLVIAILTVDANLPFCHQLRRLPEVEPHFFSSMPIYLSRLFASPFAFSIELREICIVYTLISSKLQMSLLNHSLCSLCWQRKIITIVRPRCSFIADRFDHVLFKFGTDVAITKKCSAPKRKFIVSELRKTDDCSGFEKRPKFFNISVRTFRRNPRVCTVREFVTLEKRSNVLNHKRESTGG